ncbi:Hypothetical predicted protein [Mytilus galloprovincialis]|uniref:B box-type domain-containing protein n=1 Tax=Mytilus galloprovincialis TaxID=29158 RepID=A0A8B6H0H0_MYTGA|nr:Hypothetical predicted protein [Mytilus galloprovincialis]
MASASGKMCGVCETQLVLREAALWCPECDEGLCSSCEKHHRASKATKNHEVTSVNNYKQLPPEIASIKQNCSDHDKKYQHYCSQHQELCCPLCITTNHKKCDLLAIDEIVKMSKSSALFDVMEQSLEDMTIKLGRIVEDRILNMEKFQEQRQRFETDIKEMRDKINRHLDKLETEIQHDIQAAEQKAQSQTDNLHSKIADHEKSQDELQKNIFATKMFATDLQAFFGGKMFEAEIQKEEMFLKSLTEDGSFQHIHLKFRIDDKMSDILSITKIGEILTIKNPPTITLAMDRNKQAQQSVPKIPKTINDINPTLLNKIEIPKGGRGNNISGCTIMPSGKLVFVDHVNNRLLIHDENGLFDFERPVSQRPVDVTCINEYNVAVTHNEKPYHIEIVNIANKNIVKRIKTSERCYGITNKSGKLIYYESGRGIQTVDITNGRAATTVVKVYDNHDWTYVTTSKDKIYLTDQYSSTVTCYTLTGQKV